MRRLPDAICFPSRRVLAGASALALSVVFRDVELAQGYDGYLPTHEGYLYTLDTLPLALALLCVRPLAPYQPAHDDAQRLHRHLAAAVHRSRAGRGWGVGDGRQRDEAGRTTRHGSVLSMSALCTMYTYHRAVTSDEHRANQVSRGLTAIRVVVEVAQANRRVRLQRVCMHATTRLYAVDSVFEFVSLLGYLPGVTGHERTLQPRNHCEPTQLRQSTSKWARTAVAILILLHSSIRHLRAGDVCERWSVEVQNSW